MLIRFDKQFKVGARVILVNPEDGIPFGEKGKIFFLSICNINKPGINETVHYIAYSDSPTHSIYWSREKNLKLL